MTMSRQTSKMRSRGKLVIIQMANCITGFSISNWLTLGFSFAPRDIAWRVRNLPLPERQATPKPTDNNPPVPTRLPDLLHPLHLGPVSLPAGLASPPHPQRQIRRSARSHCRPGGPRRRHRLGRGQAAVQRHQGHPRPRAHEHLLLVAADQRPRALGRHASHAARRLDANHESDLGYQCDELLHGKPRDLILASCLSRVRMCCGAGDMRGD